MSALEPPKPQQAQQAAAVPFRRRRQSIEFCIVTSSAGRWIFPKGIIGDDENHMETARNEALEEAGLHGRILDEPIGYFDISKDGESLKVIALLMEVSRSDSTWKEDEWRERRWVSADEARELFSDEILCDLLDLAVQRIEDL